MTKIDGEIKALKEVLPDGEWEVEADWHKPGDATGVVEHREVKVLRDRSGKYPSETFERAELVNGVPLHHIDDPAFIKPPQES